LELGRWEQALDLTNEITTLKRRRGASAHDTACTRFNNYGPLLSLGWLSEADQLLRECQEVFDTAGDITRLGTVHGARAALENDRGRLLDAVELQRTALRLHYTRPEPGTISVSHHNLAHYLSRIRADPGEHRAHRLAATLLNHFTGNRHELTRALGVLGDELRGDTGRLDAPALPSALSDVIRQVDAGEGVHFGGLVAALCPDADAAAQALAELLATAAATHPDRIDQHLTRWEPVITAVAAAAAAGHTPTELADFLNQGDSTDRAALAAALRGVLAGDRDREQLLVGLDDVDTAILTATLDRLSTDHGQDS
jgi:hypothetical protein